MVKPPPAKRRKRDVEVRGAEVRQRRAKVHLQRRGRHWCKGRRARAVGEWLHAAVGAAARCQLWTALQQLRLPCLLLQLQ